MTRPYAPVFADVEASIKIDNPVVRPLLLQAHVSSSAGPPQ